MKMKSFMMKRGIVVLSILAILALVLPFANVSYNVSIMGTSSGGKESVSGFAILGDGIVGWALIIGPMILVALNYVRILDNYKKILSVAIPAICLLLVIINLLYAKSLVLSAGSVDVLSVKSRTSIGIGAIALVLCYLGIAYIGLKKDYNFQFDKEGLSKLKKDGADLLDGVQNKAAQTIENAKTNIGDFVANHKAENEKSNAIDTATASNDHENTGESLGLSKTSETVVHNITVDHTRDIKMQEKETSTKRADDILSLIEKIASLKEAGILTEEEFTEKKRELLEELR